MTKLDPLTIQLTSPIEAHGEVLGEVKIRLPLTFKEVRPMFKGGLGDEDAKVLGLLTSVLRIPPSSVEAMSIGDVANIMKEIAPFLQPFQEIQGGSSPS